MLTEIYIEALLVDEELADQVWEAWDRGEIDDQIACIAWVLIVELPLCTPKADVNRAHFDANQWATFLSPLSVIVTWAW